MNGQSGVEAWGIGDWVDRRSRLSPETTAVIDAGTDETLTYAELDDRVERASRRLAAVGVGRGDHLGAVVGTRLEAVVLVHAAARVGATLVPVDPRGDAAAVRDRLDRADVVAVVCERPTEAVVVAALDGDGNGDGDRDGAETGDRDGFGDDGRRENGAESESPSRLAVPVVSVDETTGRAVTPLSSVDPESSGVTEKGPIEWGLDDRLLVLYTSGTTGVPKPVALTAGNVLASAASSALRLGVLPGDRWCCELPAYHMGGIAPFYRTAIYGTTAVVVERTPVEGGSTTDADGTGREGFDAGQTLRALVSHDATGVSLVPTQLRRLLDRTDERGDSDALPDTLRFVLLGGGPAPDELVERCGRRGVPVCPTYGLTETASQVTTARPAEATDHVGTVGRPLAFTDVVVAQQVEDDATDSRTPEGFRACAAGEPGEILVRGPTVTPGYYRSPERTAKAFTGEWFRTGDRGHLESGRLYVHGRRGDRIVTGGENVDPGAVAAAVRSVAGVRSVAVVGVPDEEWGERVTALVVCEDDESTAAPTRETVRRACRDRLPDHAVPRTVRFVDALPRTASGTVDREAARTLARETD